MMPLPGLMPNGPLTPLAGTQVGPLPGGEGNGAAPASSGPKRADYFTADRVRKIVQLAIKDNAKWKAICARSRAELSAGYASDSSVEMGGVPSPADENKVLANYIFKFVTTVLALLYADSPSIDVTPRESSGAASQGLQAVLQSGQLQGITSLKEARELYANTVRQELEYSFECGFGGQKTGAVLQDSLLCGQAWKKVIFDDESGYEDVEFLQREEVFVDPSARFDVSQARYLCHSISMPLREAQEFIAAKMDAARMLHQQAGGELDEEGNPIGLDGWNVDASFKLEELTGNWKSGEALGEVNNSTQSADKDSAQNDEFRFFELWVKEGTERFVYYSDDKNAFSFKLPWPFTFSHKEFPFAELVFYRKGEKVSDAFSELWVVDGLKRIYQLMTLYMRKRVLRAMAQKLAIKKGVFTDQKDIDKLLDSNGGELAAIEVDTQGQELKDIVSVLNFNEGDPVLVEMINILKHQFDEILGADELLQAGENEDGSGGKITATEARLRQANAHTRLGRKIGIFDQFQTRVLKLRAAVARQAVSPEKINQIAGPQGALLWSVEATHPDDFHAEYEIGIESGSSGQTHRLQKSAMLKELGQLGMGVNQMMAQTGQAPVFDIREISISTARSIDPNGDKYILPEPPPAPAMGPSPGGMPPSPVPGAGPALVGVPTSGTQQQGSSAQIPQRPAARGVRTIGPGQMQGAR